MGQQEFESQGQQFDEEIYQPQYPYTWSGQPQQEGMPRDELPGNYSTRGDQGHQHDQPQVPWWARPQPQQNGPLVFAAIVALVILLTLVAGVIGIVGIVLGSLGHLLAVILGAIFALLVFVILLVFLILSLVFRTVRRGTRPFSRYDRQARRRA